MTRRRRFAGTGLLVLAMAGAAVAQTAGVDPADAARPWWGWVLLGRLHPLVVHLPIGLILAGAGFELVQWLRRRPMPTEIGTFCLGLGLLSGAVAVWFGTLNADHQSITGESAAILERHRYSGWALLAVAAAALVVGRVARARGAARGPGGAYAVLVSVSALLVSITGHFGGQLVYGSTYVTSALPWNRGDAPPSAAQGAIEAPQPSTADARVGAALVPDAPAAPVAAGPSVKPPATSPTEPAGTSAVAPVARAVPADDDAPPVDAAAVTRAAAPPAVVKAPSSGQVAQIDAAPEPAGQVAGAPGPSPPASVVPVSGRIDFARQVEPIIRTTCVECHGPEKVKARLRMDSVAGLQAGGKNGALFVPGDPDASLLMRRVLGLDGEDQMPLDNDPLTPEQLETLRQWIAQGAQFDARAPDSQPEP